MGPGRIGGWFSRRCLAASVALAFAAAFALVNVPAVAVFAQVSATASRASPSTVTKDATTVQAAEHERAPASQRSKRKPVRSSTTEARGEARATSPTKSVEPASKSPFSGLTFSGDHGPVDIRSDTLSLDYKDKLVRFEGHVRAEQAGTELSSDSLRVKYANDFHQIDRMFADGNVRISQGRRWATSDHAVLDQQAHTVVLTGNPVVHDGTDRITGRRITVYLDTGKSVVEGARAVIFPHQTENRDNGVTADHVR
jgi:lipopolysaccharide export system protein LptA